MVTNALLANSAVDVATVAPKTAGLRVKTSVRAGAGTNGGCSICRHG